MPHYIEPLLKINVKPFYKDSKQWASQIQQAWVRQMLFSRNTVSSKTGIERRRQTNAKNLAV